MNRWGKGAEAVFDLLLDEGDLFFFSERGEALVEAEAEVFVFDIVVGDEGAVGGIIGGGG